MVLLAEPDLELQSADVAVCPVDVKGMCTSGEGDRNDAYWRQLCHVCEVDYDLVSDVITTVDRVRVRASYNGGLTVVKTQAGLFQKTADFFLHSLRAGLIPWPDRTGTFNSGHGTVSAEGGRLWGSSQASLSLAITTLGLSVRILPPSLNFPLHFYAELEPEIKSGIIPQISLVHYHHLFMGRHQENPLFAGMPGFPVESLGWLWHRVVEGANGEVGDITSKRLIVILGMHRSGTSLLTKGLEVLGVDLGADLMAPSAYNPKGYWEDVGFHDLNEELLKALDHSWDAFGFIEPEALLRLGEGNLFARALELVHARLRGKRLLGLKDPRFCLLLPFWRKVFAAAGVSVSYIVSIRNPLSVADSLFRRGAMIKSRALWLWLIYNSRIIAHTAGDSPLIVDYDEFVDEPAQQLARVAKYLDLAIKQDAMAGFLSEFISPTLRHTRYLSEDMDADPIGNSLITELHTTLCSLARASAAPPLELWRQLPSRWKHSLGEIENLLKINAALVREKRALEGQAADQRLITDKLESRILKIHNSFGWKLGKMLGLLPRR